MAYVPNSGSVVAFQGTVPFSVQGTVTVTNTTSVYADISGSVVAFQSNPANFQASVTGNVGTVGSVYVVGSVQAINAPSATPTDGTSNTNFLSRFLDSTGTARPAAGVGPYVFNGTNWDRLRGNSSVGALVSTANTSVITVNQGSVAAVIVGGSIAASFTPPANQSVSGTVGASIIGLLPVNVTNFPTNQNVSGSVVAFQGTNPWIITGSVQAAITPAGNQSVSGTVQVDVRGSVATVIIGGSIAASFTPPANQSVSGTLTVGSLLSMQGYVSTGNSISSQMSSGSVFTGTSEEVKDFSAIYVTVFADTNSATDGLSLQRSSNGTNWDILDTYTVPSLVGKTYQIQPDARFFRLQYTNSAANQGAMRLQTVYKQNYSKPSSQRPSDAYTNETDLEQMQSFGMVYNGATWDRQRGNAVDGTIIKGSIQGTVSVLGTVPVTQVTSPWIVTGSIQGAISGSVVAFQGGTNITSVSGQVTVVSSIAGGIFPISGSVAATIVGTPNVNVSGSVVAFQGGTNITSVSGVVVVSSASIAGTVTIASIVGTYAEDSASGDTNPGLFVLGVRNDTVASLVSADKDYGALTTDSAGRILMKPFAAGEASVTGNGSVNGAASVVLFAAAGAGLKNYITDFMVSNTGTATTLVTFTDADTSILGRTIAPAGGGSNGIGMATPMVNVRANTPIHMVAATATSVLYGWVSGYKAP